MAGERFISVPQAGRQYFGLSKAQSYEYANRGLIPVVRVGRRCLVPTDALDRLTAELAKSAAEVAARNWQPTRTSGEEVRNA